MRKLNFLTFMLLTTVTAVSIACNKNANTEDPSQEKVVMACKIGGTKWESKNDERDDVVRNAIYQSASTSLVIMGVANDGSTIQLTIGNFTGSTGTWTLLSSTNNSTNALASYSDASYESWFAPYQDNVNNGTIIISSFSETGRAKGTFSFTVGKPTSGTSKSITEGTFDVKVYKIN